jgi:hypothetical protein
MRIRLRIVRLFRNWRSWFGVRPGNDGPQRLRCGRICASRYAGRCCCSCE